MRGSIRKQVHRIRQREQKKSAERHQLDAATPPLMLTPGDHGGRDALERELGVDDGLA